MFILTDRKIANDLFTLDDYIVSVKIKLSSLQYDLSVRDLLNEDLKTKKIKTPVITGYKLL